MGGIIKASGHLIFSCWITLNWWILKNWYEWIHEICRVELSTCCQAVGLSTQAPSGLDILTAVVKNTCLDVGLYKRLQNRCEYNFWIFFQFRSRAWAHPAQCPVICGGTKITSEQVSCWCPYTACKSSVAHHPVMYYVVPAWNLPLINLIFI